MEVLGWKLLVIPFPRNVGAVASAGGPHLVLQYAMAAWWQPVTANCSIPTQRLAPYGNELSGLHNWDDSFQLCCALSLQLIPSGWAGSSAQVLCPVLF